MAIFLSVVLLTYGAMHLYALGKLWQVLPHSSALALGLLAFGLLMTLSPFILWWLSRLNWHGLTAFASWIVYLWMGALFLFCSTGILLDLLRLLSDLFGLGWPASPPGTLQATALLSAALLLYGVYDARQIRIEQVHLHSAKLPPGKLLKIAQISDVHLGSMLGGRFLANVIDQLRGLQPDIIVATGDIVDGQGDDFDRLAQQLHALQPPHGAYAVLGNHEYFAGLEHSLTFLHNAGFNVLRGDAVSTAGIVIAGVDDPTGQTRGETVQLNARAALASLPRNAFIVLLKHQPVEDVGTPFDLQLSGHVHGGQIFPFGLLTRLTYHIDCGLTALSDGRWLYVSRGTGTWGPPLRLLAPPEITLITLEHQDASRDR